MRCVSVCSCESYKLQPIYNFFKANHWPAKLYHNKVLYVKEDGGHVFIFSFGCFVSWGLKKRQEEKVLKKFEPFSVNSLRKIEKDYFICKFSDKIELKPHRRFNIDLIFLTGEDEQLLLALSYGLAQSIQLEYFEAAVQKTIERNSVLAESLEKKGKIPLSRKDILKRIGELFIAKSSINLSSEYLDVPEYFWEHSNIEDYYIMTEKFLDIPKRVTILNQKLDVLQELFNMLNNQLQHRHSNFLELIIISLIAIEIIIMLIIYH